MAHGLHWWSSVRSCLVKLLSMPRMQAIIRWSNHGGRRDGNLRKSEEHHGYRPSGDARRQLRARPDAASAYPESRRVAAAAQELAGVPGATACVAGGERRAEAAPGGGMGRSRRERRATVPRRPGTTRAPAQEGTPSHGLPREAFAPHAPPGLYPRRQAPWQSLARRRREPHRPGTSCLSLRSSTDDWARCVRRS